jgi:hypothetical protein
MGQKEVQSVLILHVTPCILVVYQRFGGTYCLCLQGHRVIRANNTEQSFRIFPRAQDNFLGCEAVTAATVGVDVTLCSLIIYVSEEHAASVVRI